MSVRRPPYGGHGPSRWPMRYRAQSQFLLGKIYDAWAVTHYYVDGGVLGADSTRAAQRDFTWWLCCVLLSVTWFFFCLDTDGGESRLS